MSGVGYSGDGWVKWLESELDRIGLKQRYADGGLNGTDALVFHEIYREKVGRRLGILPSKTVEIVAEIDSEPAFSRPPAIGKNNFLSYDGLSLSVLTAEYVGPMKEMAARFEEKFKEKAEVVEDF
jgi:hypothetical protein